MTEERGKSSWVDDRVFERDGIVVQVRKLQIAKPRFDYLVGRRTDRGISRFVPCWSEGSGKGAIRVKPTAQLVFSLIEEAEQYVRDELQYIEDCLIERRQSHEQRELNRGRPRPHRGLSGGPGSGKTARKRANRAGRLKEDRHGG